MSATPELRLVPVGELKPAAYNPRVISKRELANLRAGIRRFGVVEPLVVRGRDRLVLGGHQRLRAAAAEGLAEVPCVLLDCTDDEAKVLNLALNKVGGTWDVPALANLLADLRLHSAPLELTGFDTDEIDRLLGTLRHSEVRVREDVRAAPDGADAVRGEPNSDDVVGAGAVRDAPPEASPQPPRRFPDVKCPRCGECFSAF